MYATGTKTRGFEADIQRYSHYGICYDKLSRSLYPSRQCISRNLYFFEPLFSSTDLKISLILLWVSVKNFDLKLLLENKIQGLGFSFSERPTFCKTKSPNLSAAERLWSIPYRFNLFPSWGALNIHALFYLEHKVCIDLFRESKYKTLQKHIFWFMCSRGNENLTVFREWPQRMTNNTDQKNCSYGFIVVALL